MEDRSRIERACAGEHFHGTSVVRSASSFAPAGSSFCPTCIGATRISRKWTGSKNSRFTSTAIEVIEVRVEDQDLRELLLELEAANVELLREIPNRYKAWLNAGAIHCISVVENASHLKEQATPESQA